MSKETKQVIVVRMDLKMGKGKMSVQVAHASLGAILKNSANRIFGGINLENDKELNEWLNGSFAKVCVRVESEEELLELNKKAENLDLRTSLILDSGRTQFKEPTYTCLGIGPHYEEKFINLTDSLKLIPN